MRFFLLIISLILLTACSKSDESVTYKDSEGNDRKINVEDSGDTRTVTSDDGLIRAEGTQGGKNARFPDYAPQYPNAKVQSVVDMDMGPAGASGFKSHTITMMTSDSPDAVVAFYKDKVGASGKRIEVMDTQTGPMLIIGGTSMMDAEAVVTAMPISGSATSVNVVVQERVPASQ
jgi:major membrane immunogen (membrane-anchored lipoprotein)